MAINSMARVWSRTGLLFLLDHIEDADDFRRFIGGQCVLRVKEMDATRSERASRRRPAFPTTTSELPLSKQASSFWSRWPHRGADSPPDLGFWNSPHRLRYLLVEGLWLRLANVSMRLAFARLLLSWRPRAATSTHGNDHPFISHARALLSPQ